MDDDRLYWHWTRYTRSAAWWRAVDGVGNYHTSGPDDRGRVRLKNNAWTSGLYSRGGIWERSGATGCPVTSALKLLYPQCFRKPENKV